MLDLNSFSFDHNMSQVEILSFERHDTYVTSSRLVVTTPLSQCFLTKRDRVTFDFFRNLDNLPVNIE